MKTKVTKKISSYYRAENSSIEDPVWKPDFDQGYEGHYHVYGNHEFLQSFSHWNKALRHLESELKIAQRCGTPTVCHIEKDNGNIVFEVIFN